jgi:serine/threonine protein kinase
MPNDVFGIVGTTVAGAFQVVEVVAEGGFAVVYRAHHAGFKAPVALKCLKIPQYFTLDEQQAFREQFQAEAELLFKLSASIPTVVRPLHVEAVLAPDGSFMPFLALEWLEGTTLDRYVRQRAASLEGPLDLEALTLLLTPVARALDRAHRFSGPSGPVSIVHRDMKPENIFVARIGDEEVVKILDFGIATAKSMASQVAGRMSRRESEGESFSPAYAAPEQWAPKRYGQTGPWTDVWGLALTMVEVIAGHPVIDGDNAAMMGTVLDDRRRPTPRTEGLSVTDAVESVFSRALAVDPRARYADAGTFWNELCVALGIDMPEPPRSRQSGTYRAPSQSSMAAPKGLAAIASGLVGPHRGRPSDPSMVQPTAPLMVPDLELPGATHAPIARARQGAPAPLGLPRPESAPLGLPASAGAVLDADASFDSPLGLELDLDDDRSHAGPAAAVPSPAVPARLPSPPLAEEPPKAESPAPPSESGTVVPRVHALESPPTTTRRLLVPAVLVLVGIAITLADGLYASSTGEIFSLGPVRPTWIAALLVLGGIAWAIHRLALEGD